MSNQLNATQRKIVALAEIERGTTNRRDFFGNETRISFNTYANFASGSRWPRPGNLRVIEDVLGWKPGIINEALVSGVSPARLTLEHMRGEKSFGGRTSIQDFSNEEFFNDLPRRVKEIEELATKLQQHSYTYAASDDLGGVGAEELES